jgi:hypothetical protein
MPYEEAEVPQERNVTESVYKNNGESLADEASNGHENGSVETEEHVTGMNTHVKVTTERTHPVDGEEDSKGNVYTEPTQQELLERIKFIVFAMNPDNLPYFTDSEKAMEKAVAGGAENLQVLKNQCERLARELQKREVAFEPIPFQDASATVQSAETQTALDQNTTTGTREPEDDRFEDDIPYETGKPAVDSDLEIF